mmetsp:Transcript_30393/g.79736  ORF Transcript_30393/g.79736 Transcript_30393/m.79736 type:complete len:205 (-) Transcript_30393:1526-2140(-)
MRFGEKCKDMSIQIFRCAPNSRPAEQTREPTNSATTWLRGNWLWKQPLGQGLVDTELLQQMLRQNDCVTVLATVDGLHVRLAQRTGIGVRKALLRQICLLLHGIVKLTYQHLFCKSRCVRHVRMRMRKPIVGETGIDHGVHCLSHLLVAVVAPDSVGTWFTTMHVMRPHVLDNTAVPTQEIIVPVAITSCNGFRQRPPASVRED